MLSSISCVARAQNNVANLSFCSFLPERKIMVDKHFLFSLNLQKLDYSGLVFGDFSRALLDSIVVYTVEETLKWQMMLLNFRSNLR